MAEFVHILLSFLLVALGHLIAIFSPRTGGFLFFFSKNDQYKSLIATLNSNKKNKDWSFLQKWSHKWSPIILYTKTFYIARD
jgi:hypothetical protein